jgi:hypothetical protein
VKIPISNAKDGGDEGKTYDFEQTGIYNFEWNIVENTKNKIVIQLKFEEPLKMSTDADHLDQVVIEVQRSGVFVSEDNKFSIKALVRTQVDIPRQFPSEEDAKRAAEVSSFLKSILTFDFIVIIFLQFFIKSLLQRMWPLFYAIQLLVSI